MSRTPYFVLFPKSYVDQTKICREMIGHLVVIFHKSIGEWCLFVAALLSANIVLAQNQ